MGTDIVIGESLIDFLPRSDEKFIRANPNFSSAQIRV